MEKQQLKKIKKELDFYIDTICEEAKTNGEDINSDEFNLKLKNLKSKILEKFNTNINEFEKLEKEEQFKNKTKLKEITNPLTIIDPNWLLEMEESIQGYSVLLNELKDKIKESNDREQVLLKELERIKQENTLALSNEKKIILGEIQGLKARKIDWQEIENKPAPPVIPPPKDDSFLITSVNTIKDRLRALINNLKNHTIESHPEIEATTRQLNELVSGKEITLHTHKQPYFKDHEPAVFNIPQRVTPDTYTSFSGILKGNNEKIEEAVAGTDYAIPSALHDAVTVLDSATINFTLTGQQITASVIPGGLEVSNEVPTGTINGVNKTFTLVDTPVVGSEKVYKNGIRQRTGVDYTISGNIITLNTAPRSGMTMLADYQK